MPVLLLGPWVLNEIWIRHLSSALVGMLMSSSELFLFSNEAQLNSGVRPSSDVVLLPCRTKLQFGSTVARQEINSDSDVVPESNQIQGILKPRNNSPPNSPRERNLAKTH